MPPRARQLWPTHLLTDAQVGAEVGVGMTENLRTGTNWKLFGKTFLGWVGSFATAALVTAAFYAFCEFAPVKSLPTPPGSAVP